METKKIAIQGVAGSFHEVAAHKFFGDNIETIDCETFKILCEKISGGEVDFAIMAIENTIAGSLLQNYALIREYYLRIIGEVYLHIQMNLMANKGVKISDLKFIHSHPMAIRQCTDFLQNYPEIKVLEKSDTAESAKLIKEQNLTDTAAIAGLEAAKVFDLEVLEKGIETNKRNYTRFVILSTTGNPTKSSNKASISIEVGHQPGSLAKILNIFAECQINLTKIQSVPILGRPYQYTFHIDLEWTETENYEKAIHSVLKNASSLSILGEYKKGEFNNNGGSNPQM